MDRTFSSFGGTTMLVVFAATTGLFGIRPLPAQEADDAAQAAQAADLAKQVQNPLANLVTIPFQVNLNRGVGQFDRTVANVNFQPVIPFPGKKWNIIARAIIPFVSVPVGETSAETGIGDWNLTVFASPARPGSVVWGVGPAFVLPFSSNPEFLGSGKLSLGPSAVVFAGAGNFTFGGVASNVWSIADVHGSDREDVNQFFLQYFVNFNFGAGWALGTAPIITCDWTAPSGEQCTIPWGLQISKVLHFGSRPSNVLLGFYTNSEYPPGGAKGQVRIQINLLFPQTGN